MQTLTDEQVVELAKDIWAGKVFTSGMLPDHEKHILCSVFMPLAFMSSEEIQEMKDVAFIYEHMSASGKSGINGYPIFMSFRTVSTADAERVTQAYDKIIKAMDAI